VRNETSVHSGVYASWYEKSKCLAHAAVVEFSKNHPGVVIAMPALAMGPGGDDILGVYIKAFCEKKLPFLVALENPVSYVHVDDLAEGLCLCMEKGVSGQQYIFSADDCTPNQLADFLSRFSGKPKPRFILPPNLATPLLFIDELISYLTHKRPALTIESLKVLKQKSWIYSGEKARKELGWRPRSMEQMVQATVN
jgi:dihydroflavonol-4-reductase